MLFDVAALGLLGLFAAWGAWRGTLASAMALLAWAAGYAAALLAALRSGAAVAAALGVPAWLGAPLAGIVAFTAVFGLVAGLAGLLRRRGRPDGGRSGIDRLGGALLGGLRGAFAVLLVGILALGVDAWKRAAGDAPGAAPSPLRAATRRALDAAVDPSLTGAGPGAVVTVRAITRPAETWTGLQAVLSDRRVGDLMDDRVFWIQLENQSIEAALDRWSFQRIAHDARLRRELADLGLVAPASAEDPERFRAEAREVLAQLAPRVRRLRRDPEVRRLAEDPEVAALVQRGDWIALLGHPGFRHLVAATLAAEPETG